MRSDLAHARYPNRSGVDDRTLRQQHSPRVAAVHFRRHPKGVADEVAAGHGSIAPAIPLLTFAVLVANLRMMFANPGTVMRPSQVGEVTVASHRHQRKEIMYQKRP